LSRKDIFEEERKRFKITVIVSHHKGTGRAIIMERRRLGTKTGIKQSTKMSDTQKGGKLRTK